MQQGNVTSTRLIKFTVFPGMSHLQFAKNTTAFTAPSSSNWILQLQDYLYVRLSKLLVHEKDINIIWKGPIANHSFVAILPPLGNIDLQGASLRLNTAQVDMILYLYYYAYCILVCTTSSKLIVPRF